MRIFAISDLHVDHERNQRWLSRLSKVDYREDALVVAGDVSHRLDRVAAALGGLRERFARVFFVPGNHDLWLLREDDVDSLAKFYRLRELCDGLEVEMDPAVLAGPDGLDEVRVVPLLSWYTRPEEGPGTLYVRKRGEDRSLSMWVDSWAVRWPDFGGGITPSAYFLGRNEPGLISAAAVPAVTFSHFLPRRELMFPTPAELWAWRGPFVDPMPEFNFSMVAGTVALDRQLRRAGSVVHVYGHQHRNRRLDIGGVRYLSYGLGSPRERDAGRVRGVTDAPALVWDGPPGAAQGAAPPEEVLERV